MACSPQGETVTATGNHLRVEGARLVRLPGPGARRLLRRVVARRGPGRRAVRRRLPHLGRAAARGGHQAPLTALSAANGKTLWHASVGFTYDVWTEPGQVAAAMAPSSDLPAAPAVTGSDAIYELNPEFCVYAGAAGQGAKKS